MPEVRIELGGAPRLHAADGRIHALERHDAALLALLVVEPRVARSRAAELLWPGRSAERARNSLRQRLFRLRRAAGHVLVTGDDCLSLAEGVLSDWPARAADDANKDSVALLDGHRYDDLDEFDEWLQHARDHWRAACRARWIAAADTLEREGRFVAALRPALQLLHDEPLDEAAHRRVIRLHYLHGDRTAALDAVQRCQARLADELGVEPDSETQGLARLVERGAIRPAAAPAAVPPGLLRTPRLVGREAVWQELTSAWARRQVILLGGEAGIGKSRLAREFAGVRSGALFCGARVGDAAQPYALLARLLQSLRQRVGEAGLEAAQTAELARVAPEYGAAPPTPADEARLQQAVRAALAQGVAQGLQGLVIDDLHFADAASVDALLDWLGNGASAALPHLLIARSGEWPPALLQRRDAGFAGPGLAIELPPLDEAGMCELLGSLEIDGLADVPRWSQRLLRHTGGHPLFTLETLIACHQSGGAVAFADDAPLPAPQGVARLIDRRLAQLSPAALRLVRVMAVAGADCGAEVFAAVLGREVVDLIDAWHELRQRHIAGDGGFAHDLIEAAVLRTIPQEIRRALHARIGPARLAQGHAPARVARHYHEAGSWVDAAVQWLAAAEAAARQSRRDEEVDLLGAAIEAFERGAEPERAYAARLQRAETMMTTGSLERARDECALLASTARHVAQRLRQRILAAKLALAAADAGAAVGVAREAEAIAGELGNRDAAFSAGQLTASALASSGRAAEALAKLEALAPLAQTCSDPRELCEYRGAVGYVLCVVGRRRQAVPHLREAAERAQAMGATADAMTLWSNLAGTLTQTGQIEQGAALAEQAHALALHAGARQGVAVGSNETMLGLAWGALGRYADAERVLLDALQRFRSAGAAIWVYAAEGMLANLYISIGQIARAKRTLSPAPPDMPVPRRARRLVVEARIERALGRSGLKQLDAAMALIDGSPQRSMDRIGTTLAWAAAASPDAALPRLRQVLEASEAQELDGMVLSARLRELDALRRHGDGAASAVLARRAEAMATQCQPHDVYEGEFWWLLAKAYDAGGERDAADATLQRAACWVQRVLPQMPEAYRDAFVHRHPVNGPLLAEAARRSTAVRSGPQ